MGRHTEVVLCRLPFHSPGGATKLLLFRVLLHKSLLCQNVRTQSSTFVFGVPTVRQLLPTPNRSATSLTTLILLVSVGFVQFGGGNHVVNFYRIGQFLRPPAGPVFRLDRVVCIVLTVCVAAINN